MYCSLPASRTVILNEWCQCQYVAQRQEGHFLAVCKTALEGNVVLLTVFRGGGEGAQGCFLLTPSALPGLHSTFSRLVLNHKIRVSEAQGNNVHPLIGGTPKYFYLKTV